ncbi:MAG TPA: hypothetical protein VHC20_06640 [Candidatus Paceibacterota bacterium]|nr:hypothetical protein [Candidatus Paceibacterota bacterium]
MRALTAALAIGGIPWCFLVGILLFSSVSAFTAGEQRDMEVIVFSALSLLGFFIWVGWVIHALKERYLVRSWAFWFLSAATHLGWAMTFRKAIGASMGSSSAGGWLFSCMLCWILLNVALGVILGLVEYLDRKNA